jgi:cytochrome P450 family 4 subfamily V
LIKIIEERLASFNMGKETNSDDKKNTGRRVFLDNLLAQMHNEKLTINDIQEEVDTFMFEGHDTTAAAITFFCYLVGCHPDVQAKIHAEMDSIFGGNNFAVFSMEYFCSFFR